MTSDTAPFSASQNKALERELPFPACQHTIITVCRNALVDLMYRAYGRARRPLIVYNVVADFQAGGFSADCYDKFRDEFIELLRSHRDGVKKRCRTDRRHLRLIMTTLYGHCTYLTTDAAARRRAGCTVLYTMLVGMPPRPLPEFHSFLLLSSPILV